MKTTMCILAQDLGKANSCFKNESDYLRNNKISINGYETDTGKY